jgi:hypothetical protein
MLTCIIKHILHKNSLWASLAPYLNGKVQLWKMSDGIHVDFEVSTAAIVKMVAFWI